MLECLTLYCKDLAIIMITVISPAKKLSKDCKAMDGLQHSTCEFLDSASNLVTILKEFEPDRLSDLMSISENLSILNWERFQNWSIPFNADKARQAMYSFIGDTYSGFDIESLPKDDIEFCQNHTRILSGLYGLLRPLDLIMPYRLEMGTRLKHDNGNDLYTYWNKDITRSLNKSLELHQHKAIINCASVEYFKVIDLNKLQATVWTPVFKDVKKGKLRIISFFAKKARGAMARFIVSNKIENPEFLQDFEWDGYKFNNELSNKYSPVFVRG
tara:strand:+ start:288 stop:1103 length:816 start_codon:yes stop_codon:yes gene_type:complete